MEEIFEEEMFFEFILQFVLVITCLRERFRIDYPKAFLKIMRLWNYENFKIFENYESDLSQKSPEPNKWLLVNHTKSKNTLYWN